MASFLLDLIWFLFYSLWINTKELFRWILPATYKSVSGEVCLITGGGSGIGRIMALEFARKGATIALWDINEKGNEETAEMVRELGATVFADSCDLSKKEEIKSAAGRLRERVGDVTILVNNAGVTFCKTLLDLTDSQIELTFKVNTIAHAWTLREFLPTMLRNDHGHIVTIASTVGLFATPGMPDYNASKHGAVGLHQSLYYDLADRDGVKTTLVCPYHIHTGMFSGVRIKYPWLLPSLTPQGCVDAIMHAVLTDREMVAIPRSMYLSHYLSTILPMKIQRAQHAFIGSKQSIERFIPNRDYQKEQ